MDIRIPTPLKVEHEELHAELVALTKAPGRVGEAARRVASLLHPHFVKEEEYALPPLGLAEHRQVVGSLEALAEAGRAEKQPEAVRFAEKLRLHAEFEEDVLYPAAILLGEHVKARLAG
jgi:hypothetical protein